MPLAWAPDVAQEQLAGQEAAPRVRAVPVGRAGLEPRPAPVEELLGGRVPAGAALGQAPVGPGPRKPEARSCEPEPAVRVAPVRMAPLPSAAAVVLAVSVSQGGLAVPIPAPAELDWSGAPSARGEEPPQGWVESQVLVRLAAPRRGSAIHSSVGSLPDPRRDRGPFPVHCGPVWALVFFAVGRPSAVCRRVPAEAWVR